MYPQRYTSVRTRARPAPPAPPPPPPSCDRPPPLKKQKHLPPYAIPAINPPPLPPPPSPILLMNAPNSKDADKMKDFLQQQIETQRSREVILKITETCWDQCISAQGKV